MRGDGEVRSNGEGVRSDGERGDGERVRGDGERGDGRTHTHTHTYHDHVSILKDI